jgi:bifunctional non-homologous end joining protein LigD
MAGELESYNRKRDFEKTDEPEGRRAEPGKRLRFVVQHHMARRDHFDFRLEWNGVLLSWAVPKGPSYDPHDRRLAVEVEDHPLEYRDFEGTIPHGEYGGGTVMIWDKGYWEPQEDVGAGRESGDLKIVLKGRRLRGKWALVRMKPKENEDDKNWLLIKEKDQYVLDHDGISGFNTSVKTGRTMAEISEGRDAEYIRNPFDRTDIQLAKLVNAVPEGPGWLYELKYDGYRIVSYIEGGNARLMTRNGQDYTRKFQTVADSIIEWADNSTMVLDGEVVVQDADGRPNFQKLQNYIKNPQGENLVYMVFDLLALDGEDLRGSRLADRKEKLASLLENAPENLRYSSHIEGGGNEIFLAACKASLEGIVCKHRDSIYSGTRNGDWVKLKCGARQEFVIGGYTLTDRKTGGISALLLGVYEGNDLIYAGRVGTGFTSRTEKELLEEFKKVVSVKPPFKSPPRPRTDEKITWLRPELVAEVRFAEWTGDNLLRQASFKGLRTDKAPYDVKRENTQNKDETITLTERSEEMIPPKKEPGKDTSMKPDTKSISINGVRITSPDKVMIEGSDITKEEVARYYEKVSEWMLPYVGNRVLSIVRCPDGTSKACFYQKHPGPSAKGIVRIPVKENDGNTEEYFYIEDAEGLLFEVQMGTLEFHIWGSRVDQLEKPDMMVFDLDPGEGLDLRNVRQGVRDMKLVLDEISLVSFLKTSGGKGYHVVVPLEPSVGWDAFHHFARMMAEAMEQRWPDRYTSNVRKVNRTGRIFIDWIRNGRSATSIAPYSIRARKGGPVSMPISWAELDTVIPNGIGMEDAIRRIDGDDPWKDFYAIKQRLKGV